MGSMGPSCCLICAKNSGNDQRAKLPYINMSKYVSGVLAAENKGAVETVRLYGNHAGHIAAVSGLYGPVGMHIWRLNRYICIPYAIIGPIYCICMPSGTNCSEGSRHNLYRRIAVQLI